MVIDDREDVRILCVAMLEAALGGVEVVPLRAAVLGFEAINADTVALVTDIGLLGDNDDSGLYVIKVARECFEGLPIIAMSGRPEVAAAALTAGADYFLAKPFRLKHLKAALVSIGLLEEG